MNRFIFVLFPRFGGDLNIELNYCFCWSSACFSKKSNDFKEDKTELVTQNLQEFSGSDQGKGGWIIISQRKRNGIKPDTILHPAHDFALQFVTLMMAKGSFML